MKWFATVVWAMRYWWLDRSRIRLVSLSRMQRSFYRRPLVKSGLFYAGGLARRNSRAEE